MSSLVLILENRTWVPYIFALLLLGTVCHSSADIYVSPLGTDSLSCGAQLQPCLSLNYVLNNRFAASGGTIRLISATFTNLCSSLIVNASVSIIGANSIWDCGLSPNSTALTISNSSVSLQGITFANSYAFHSGPAITFASSQLSVTNCTFVNNTVMGTSTMTYYGAVYGSNSVASFTNVHFLHNTITASAQVAT